MIATLVERSIQPSHNIPNLNVIQMCFISTGAICETSYILLLKGLQTLSISGFLWGHFLSLILIRSNTLMRALAHYLDMFLSIRHITMLRDLFNLFIKCHSVCPHATTYTQFGNMLCFFIVNVALIYPVQRTDLLEHINPALKWIPGIYRPTPR